MIQIVELYSSRRWPTARRDAARPSPGSTLSSVSSAHNAQRTPNQRQSSPRKKGSRHLVEYAKRSEVTTTPASEQTGDGVLGGVSVARANWELKIAEEGGERADRLRLAGLMLTSCFPVMTHLSANSSQSTATSQHIFFPVFFFFLVRGKGFILYRASRTDSEKWIQKYG